MINKISFKNYKLFKEKQTLELKPITILIGKNNSGKSAVLKLPTMISESLNADFNAPILLENSGIKIGLSYEDLFYNREITGEALEFGISNDTNSIQVSLTGDRFDKINITKYIYNGNEININESTRLKGFLINDIAKQINFKFDYDYIDSIRFYPDNQFSDIYGEYNKIGANGENSYKLLAQYSQLSNPILSKISEWFDENFEGWKLAVKDISGTTKSYEIVLYNKNVKPINIFNTGSGIKQSLPLIVRSFMPVEEETLIIIEEPETHLHPAAHGNLAERFVDSYREDNKRKYLIETHSENFILRIQRLIADKTISKDEVKIYYVDYDENEFCSSLKEVIIEDDGEIEDWPDNVFNESLDEVIKLRKAQKDRENADSNS